MKKLNLKIITLLIITLTNFQISKLFAQVPQAFKYQAVANYSDGQAISNQEVGFQISLLQGSETGSSVYTETHTITTNEQGLVNINIGRGNSTDNFTTIDWSNGPYFIKVEMDTTGGSNYKLMGVSELMSVPFAKYAEFAGTVGNGTQGVQPTACFTSNVDSLFTGMILQLDASCSENAESYEWLFGDMTSANGKIVTHTIPTDFRGTDYTVLLKVKSIDGKSSDFIFKAIPVLGEYLYYCTVCDVTYNISGTDYSYSYDVCGTKSEIEEVMEATISSLSSYNPSYTCKKNLSDTTCTTCYYISNIDTVRSVEECGDIDEINNFVKNWANYEDAYGYKTFCISNGDTITYDCYTCVWELIADSTQNSIFDFCGSVFDLQEIYDAYSQYPDYSINCTKNNSKNKSTSKTQTDIIDKLKADLLKKQKENKEAIKE